MGHRARAKCVGQGAVRERKVLFHDARLHSLVSERKWGLRKERASQYHEHRAEVYARAIRRHSHGTVWKHL